MGFLRDVFDPSGLTPHGFCLLWQPGLIWLQAISDGAIALAYFAIPVVLTLLVVRRNDLDFGWIYLLFAAFILSCGVTHVMSIVTLWDPVYGLEGAIKAVTAAVSVLAALSMWRLLPQALALPSPSALQDANDKLSFRISESETAQRRLRESEAQQRNIFVHMPTALYLLDPDGRIREASEQMASLLGRTRADIIGRDIADFLPDNDREDRLRTLRHAAASADARDRETQFVTSGGTVIDAVVSSRVDPGLGGAPGNVITVVTDVTARRRAEAALRESEDRLRQSQKMEAIGQLTGGIAHDFNNMLTVIDGNLERLRDRLAGDPALSHLLDQADHASQRAVALIEQLLAFSRKQRLEPRPINAREVIVGMQALLSRVAGEQVSLLIDEGEPCWSCLADRNQLEAGVVNLVINATQAIKAGGRGKGEIRISVTNTVVRRSDDWRGDGGDAPTPGEYVRVLVRDNGVGMSDEVKRRALEPFFTTKGIGTGSGLGLSQTYGFVCQSNGAMRIESAPGRGATIEILLPRTDVAAAADDGIEERPVAAAAPAMLLEARRPMLLVVEDEPAVLEIAASSLRDSGFEVVSAGDGPTALALLKATPGVSLVFTDIVMPGQSGVALAAEIWTMWPELPVVFASGYAEETVIRQLPAGSKFIKKPYRIGSVVALIRAALNERVATEEMAQDA